MKKILIIIVLLTLIGCALNNTPTSKVEELLGKYQGLKVEYNYQDLVQNDSIPKEIKNKYKEIIKKQYQSLTYEVKEETIDGNNATVTTEIEVLNYKEILDTYDINAINDKKIHKEIIEKLNKTKDKTVYTIDFTITKSNSNWKLNPITEEQQRKLLGIY